MAACYNIEQHLPNYPIDENEPATMSKSKTKYESKPFSCTAIIPSYNFHEKVLETSFQAESFHTFPLLEASTKWPKNCQCKCSPPPDRPNINKVDKEIENEQNRDTAVGKDEGFMQDTATSPVYTKRKQQPLQQPLQQRTDQPCCKCDIDTSMSATKTRFGNSTKTDPPRPSNDDSLLQMLDDNLTKQTPASSGPSRIVTTDTIEACTCCGPDAEKRSFQQQTPANYKNNSNGKSNIKYSLLSAINGDNSNKRQECQLARCLCKETQGTPESIDQLNANSKTNVQYKKKQTKKSIEDNNNNGRCNCITMTTCDAASSFSKPDVRPLKQNETNAIDILSPCQCWDPTEDQQQLKSKKTDQSERPICLCKKLKNGFYCYPPRSSTSLPEISTKYRKENHTCRNVCCGTDELFNSPTDYNTQASNTHDLPSQDKQIYHNETNNESTAPGRKGCMFLQNNWCSTGNNAYLACKTKVSPVNEEWKNILSSCLTCTGRFQGLRGGSPPKQCNCPPGQCREGCPGKKEVAVVIVSPSPQGSERASTQGGQASERASTQGGQASERASTQGGQASERASTQGGQASERASTQGGQASERASTQAGQASERASTQGGQASERASTQGGQASERVSTQAGQASERASTQGGQASERASTQGGQASERASAQGGQASAPASERASAQGTQGSAQASARASAQASARASTQGTQGSAPASERTSARGAERASAQAVQGSERASVQASATVGPPTCVCAATDCKRKASTDQPVSASAPGSKPASKPGSIHGSAQGSAPGTTLAPIAEKIPKPCTCPMDVPCKPKCEERKIAANEAGKGAADTAASEATPSEAAASEAAPSEVAPSEVAPSEVAPSEAAAPGATTECECSEAKCARKASVNADVISENVTTVPASELPSKRPSQTEQPDICNCPKSFCHPACKDAALQESNPQGCAQANEAADIVCEDKTCEEQPTAEPGNVSANVTAPGSMHGSNVGPPCICPDADCSETPPDAAKEADPNCICPPEDCIESGGVQGAGPAADPSCICPPAECTQPASTVATAIQSVAPSAPATAAQSTAVSAQGSNAGPATTCAESSAVCEFYSTDGSVRTDAKKGPIEQAFSVTLGEDGNPLRVDGTNQKVIAYSEDGVPIVIPVSNTGCVSDPNKACAQTVSGATSATGSQRGSTGAVPSTKGCLQDSNRSCNRFETMAAAPGTVPGSQPTDGLTCKCTTVKCIKSACEMKKRALLAKMAAPSAQGATESSKQGSIQGSKPVSMQGSKQVSTQGATEGETEGVTEGSKQPSKQGSTQIPPGNVTGARPGSIIPANSEQLSNEELRGILKNAPPSKCKCVGPCNEQCDRIKILRTEINGTGRNSRSSVVGSNANPRDSATQIDPKTKTNCVCSTVDCKRHNTN